MKIETPKLLFILSLFWLLTSCTSIEPGAEQIASTNTPTQIATAASRASNTPSLPIPSPTTNSTRVAPAATAHVLPPAETAPVPTGIPDCYGIQCPAEAAEWLIKDLPVHRWSDDSWLKIGQWADNSNCVSMYTDDEDFGSGQSAPELIKLNVADIREEGSSEPCELITWSDQDCLAYRDQHLVGERQWLILTDTYELLLIHCDNGIMQANDGFQFDEISFEIISFPGQETLFMIVGAENYSLITLNEEKTQFINIETIPETIANLDDGIDLSPSGEHLAIYHIMGGLSVYTLDGATGVELTQYWFGERTYGIGPVAQPRWLNNSQVFLPTSDILHPTIYTIGDPERQHILEEWLGINEELSSWYGLSRRQANDGFSLLIYHQSRDIAYLYNSPSGIVEQIAGERISIDYNSGFLLSTFYENEVVRVDFRSLEPNSQSKSIEVPGSSAYVHFSNGGQFIAIHTGAELYVFEVETQETIIQAHFPGGDRPRFPLSWSPDNNSLLLLRRYENRPDHELYLIDFSNR